MIVREIQVKDYLTPSKIGQYAINPYIGCPHACKYCYAEFMKRFTHHSEPWGTFLDVKLCDKPISLKRISGENVFMSTVTDCYNPFEEKYKITRRILGQLAESDCFLQISTKNKLILRDLDLLKQIKHLSVAMSVNTLDEGFRRDMDRASSIAERLETLRTLHESGIYTILFMSPIFVFITDWKAIIEASSAFISEYWFEDLNLRGGYKYTVLKYIADKYPALLPLYKEIYQEGRPEPVLAVEDEIRAFCAAQGLRYSDYFHHKEVIAKTHGGILGKNGV
jgi:DNA repair photolyase